MGVVVLLGSLACCSHSPGPGSVAVDGSSLADAGRDDAGPVSTVLVGPSGDHAFLPASLTVPLGTTVEWFWESDGHTVTSGPGGVADGEFCSPDDTGCTSAPTSLAGTTYRHTFTKRGTFPYFCVPHYSVGMKGTITVN